MTNHDRKEIIDWLEIIRGHLLDKDVATAMSELDSAIDMLTLNMQATEKGKT